MNHPNGRRDWIDDPDPWEADELYEPTLEDLIKQLPASTRYDGGDAEPNSSFTFPPPAVAAPPAISSIAPVAMGSEGDERKAPERGSSKGIAAAIALVVLSTVSVLGGYALVSEHSNASWGQGWKLRSPSIATITALAAGDEQLTTRATPSLADLSSIQPRLPAARVLLQSPRHMATAVPVPARKAEASAEDTPSTEKPREASADVKAAAGAALGSALTQAVGTCREQGMAPVTARVTAVFHPWGRVDSVVVNVPSGASEVGGCLAREARSAQIDPFDAEQVHATRLITVR